MALKMVKVILEHDGSGNKATPIGVIEVDPHAVNDGWREEAWLRARNWNSRPGREWVKTESNLYGSVEKYAVISDAMYLEEI